jgi:hypothetical protein
LSNDIPLLTPASPARQLSVVPTDFGQGDHGVVYRSFLR